MKRIIALILMVVLCSISVAACGKNDVITNPVIPNGYKEFAIKEAKIKKTEGYGVQIDTHMYKEYNSLSADELQMFYDRALEMNVQNIRTQVFPEWYERGNDNNDYDSFDGHSPNVQMNSKEMLDLWKLLDFCQINDIKVDLSFYGCNSLFKSEDGLIDGSWLGAPFTKNWVTAPKQVDETGKPFNGYEEYAETVYALLNYVLSEKKYTCVNEFSIYPEPNLSFVLADGTVSHKDFVMLCKKVDAKLKKENIRNKIQFSGPASATTNVSGFQAYIKDLDSVFDKYTASTYKYDSTNDNETFSDFGDALSGMTGEVDKTFGIAEFGSKNVMDPANQTDIDTYDRAMYLARYMICLTNNGCTNMKYWVLGDVMYGGYVMRLGLWKFRNENWQARPQYYTWSLICKYSEVGSLVYPIISSDTELCMVALKLPDGNWSYMVANSSDAEKKISLVNYNKGYPKSMNVFEVRESLCNGTVKPVASSAKISIVDGAINYKVKGNSFVVFSTRV